jgi:hypothetical protein
MKELPIPATQPAWKVLHGQLELFSEHASRQAIQACYAIGISSGIRHAARLAF